MHQTITARPAAVLAWVLLTAACAVAFPSNHWQHIQNRCFTVSYTEESAHLAAKALGIAQQTADTLAAYFGYNVFNGRVAIVLMDEDDFSNGEASELVPCVKIYCRKTGLLWRGETDWLRTVISHELSHIYSLDVMRIPLLIFADVNVHSEPGKTDAAFSTYYEHNILPPWFVEGIAQAGSYRFKADARDAFREMLLRDACLNNKLLSLDQMTRFEGTSREYELVYNQGFDFILYLAENYAVTMKKVCARIASEGFERGMRTAYGKPVESLYEEWRHSLQSRLPRRASKPVGPCVFPQKARVFNMETAQAGNGRYVVANWRHDYALLDLFVMTDKNARLAAHDVGSCLRWDAASGSVWFTRNTYNYRMGVDNHDLYRMDKRGTVTRVTRGARCLAFDVKDGRLVFAAYRNGTTSVIRRAAGSRDDTLCAFQSDTDVSTISIMGRDSVLLSMGTGRLMRTFLLAGRQVRPLWKTVDADVTDIASAGGDTVLFVSTIDGTPQLYWCALSRRPGLWHKVTGLAGGAAYPAVEGSGAAMTVTCSVYENGKFVLRRLDAPFSASDSVTVPGDTSAEAAGTVVTDTLRKDNDSPAADEVEMTEDSDSVARAPAAAASRPPEAIDSGAGAPEVPKVAYYPAGSNFVTGLPFLGAAYSYSRLTDPAAAPDAGLLTWGQFTTGSAPGDLALNAQGGLFFRFGAHSASPVTPSLQASVNKSIGPWRLSAGYLWEKYDGEWAFPDTEFDSSFYPAYHFVSSSIEQVIGCSAAFQTSSHSVLRPAYRYAWRANTLTASFDNPNYRFAESNSNALVRSLGTVLESHRCDLEWSYLDGAARFDPANLGPPAFAAKIGASLLYNSYYSAHYYDTVTSLLGPVAVGQARGEISRSLWNSSGDLSLKFKADGFAYFGGMTPRRIAAFTYEYLGDGYFDGYPSRSLRLRQAYRLTTEARVCPFGRTEAAVGWARRMHVRTTLEAGSAEYFDDSLGARWTTPLSLECGMEQGFYVFPDRRSSVYLAVAYPLRRIAVADVNESHRLYFAFEL